MSLIVNKLNVINNYVKSINIETWVMQSKIDWNYYGKDPSFSI
jgi:hypothetical protein